MYAKPAHQKQWQHTVFDEQLLPTIGPHSDGSESKTEVRRANKMTTPLRMNDAGELPLPISGCDVAYLRVDYAFTLVVDHPKGTFELRIGSPFRFADTFGASVIDPELEPELLGPVLRLSRSTIEFAAAFSDGRVELTFDGGSSLSVPAEENYEAWQLAGPGGFRVICTPGGELAIWDYKPSV